MSDATNHSSAPKVWTIDVPILGRAVDVHTSNGRYPRTQDLIGALEYEEDQRRVQQAHDDAVKELARNQLAVAEQREHDCARASCGCCPGCLDGCGRCEPRVLCWDRELGCVMSAGHTGRCVPAGSPWISRTAVDDLAEPLRVAGIEHTLEQHTRNPERWRLHREIDHRVPDSGLWVRRWTPHNTQDTQQWLEQAGYAEFVVREDDKGPLLMNAHGPAGRRLDLPMGDVVRLQGGTITIHDGGWVNCGRGLPPGWQPSWRDNYWPGR